MFYGVNIMRNEWKNENLREVPQGTWWGRRERAALAKTRDQSVAAAQLLSEFLTG